jgi:NADP-dependent 3-hydroxy acid dehydrogenase YdfG
MKTLSESVIWITGASRGIGAACAQYLVRTGARVALSARKGDSLTTLTEGFASDAQFHVVPCDVANSASIDAAYKDILFKYGCVDILLNNAGVGIFAPLTELTTDDIDTMLNTNLRGAILCTHAVLPDMVRNGGGVIVNINSVAAIKTFTSSSVYAASKAGLLAASRSVREEVRGYGVKVIDLMIGATETDIWSIEARSEFSTRMMKPDDIAEALLATLKLPPHTMPEELVLRPQKGDL